MNQEQGHQRQKIILKIYKNTTCVYLENEGRVVLPDDGEDHDDEAEEQQDRRHHADY